MSDIMYAFSRSFIDAFPFIITVVLIFFFIRKPLTKFIALNFLDSGKDRYNIPSDKNIEKVNDAEKKSIIEDNIKSKIHEALINESGKEYFQEYKTNLETLIKERQNELTSHVLKNIHSDNKIEVTILESLNNAVEKNISKLARDSKKLKELEDKFIERLNFIKISSFLEHLEKEYDATRSTKALMSNMFIMVNIFYFFGLLAFLIFNQRIITSPSLYLALSFSYIGLGSFVVYMIKFCNSRSLTLLSLREDFLKREQTSSMATKMIEIGTSEHHVALLQLMNSNMAIKEQKVNHPYEMLLYGIKDSNIMFKGGKFEIKKESSEKINR